MQRYGVSGKELNLRVGQSLDFRAIVYGNLPDGLTMPYKISTIDGPDCSPGRPAMIAAVTMKWT